jgi:hypothetical protein
VVAKKSDKSQLTGGLCSAIESAIEPNTMFSTWAWGEQILIHKEPITARCFGYLDKSEPSRHLIHLFIGHLNRLAVPSKGRSRKSSHGGCR